MNSAPSPQQARITRQMQRVESARLKLRWRIEELENALARLTEEVQGEHAKHVVSSVRIGRENRASYTKTV